MNRRNSNNTQKSISYFSVIMFIISGLGALAVFIYSFFSSPELIVSLRVIAFIILLIPFAFLFIIKPIFSLFSGGIFGDRRVLKKLLTGDNSYSSLRIDDPKSKDWLFSDERLHGRAWVDSVKRIGSVGGRYHSEQKPEDKYFKADEIKSKTITRRKRFYERGVRQFKKEYPILDRDVRMVVWGWEKAETEEEKVNKLKQIPRFSHEISIMEEMIDDLGGRNRNIHLTPKGIIYSFNFAPNHKFSIFIRVTVKTDIDNEIIVEAIYKDFQPFSLSLLVLENEEIEGGNTSNLYKKYSIKTTYSIDYKRILTKTTIESSLTSLYPLLERLVISEKFLSLTLRDKEGVEPSLVVAKEIYEELILLDSGVVEIREIRCYTCDTVFETDTEKCKKCGSLRPRCIVCILELYPSEKSKIITTPCCGVLAHKEHIIMWLKRNKTCPNCKKSLSRWSKKLE